MPRLFSFIKNVTPLKLDFKETRYLLNRVFHKILQQIRHHSRYLKLFILVPPECCHFFAITFDWDILFIDGRNGEGACCWILLLLSIFVFCWSFYHYFFEIVIWTRTRLDEHTLLWLEHNFLLCMCRCTESTLCTAQVLYMYVIQSKRHKSTFIIKKHTFD